MAFLKRNDRRFSTNWAEDRRAGLKADLKELDEQLNPETQNPPDRQRVGQADGATAGATLETKRDAAWRAYDGDANKIEAQKDGLSDQVEKRLRQDVADEQLFATRFQIV